MVANQKPTGRAMTMPGGLAVGVLLSMGILFGCVAALAKLIEMEWLLESSIGYGIMVIHLAATFVGAMVSCDRIKRRRMLVCGLHAVIYYGVLLAITALCFGGQYTGMGVTALLTAGGCFLAVLPGLWRGRGVEKGLRKRRYC
jgi:putative membrane protein (TIGR04086 family)